MKQFSGTRFHGTLVHSGLTFDLKPTRSIKIEELTEALKALPQRGIYCFTAIIEGVEQFAYVGQTKRLSGRMTDYLNKIQVTSINDYKIRAAADALEDLYDGVIKFNLYFLPVDESINITLLETQYINDCEPFINGCGKLVGVSQQNEFAHMLTETYKQKIITITSN